MMLINRFIIFVFTTFLLCGFVCAKAGEVSSTKSAVNSYKVKTSVNKRSLEVSADRYFYEGIEASDTSKKEALLSKALEKYMLLLKLRPNDVVTCTQIGVIHDNLNRPAIAKDYFLRALNLDNLNPYANFYYAEYFFAKKEYQNALNYYLIAYNNGYDKYFPVNIKLATVYEKLGDIEKAKKYYIAASKQNPSQNGLRAKIESLGKVYYSRSDYYRK